MVCSIFQLALSILMKHLVIGQRQKAPNFSIFHWSPHGRMVSIGQHLVTSRIVHIPKRTKISLGHSCNSWFSFFFNFPFISEYKLKRDNSGALSSYTLSVYQISKPMKLYFLPLRSLHFIACFQKVYCGFLVIVINNFHQTLSNMAAQTF